MLFVKIKNGSVYHIGLHKFLCNEKSKNVTTVKTYEFIDFTKDRICKQCLKIHQKEAEAK